MWNLVLYGKTQLSEYARNLFINVRQSYGEARCRELLPLPLPSTGTCPEKLLKYVMNPSALKDHRRDRAPLRREIAIGAWTNLQFAFCNWLYCGEGRL